MLAFATEEQENEYQDSGCRQEGHYPPCVMYLALFLAFHKQGQLLPDVRCRVRLAEQVVA